MRDWIRGPYRSGWGRVFKAIDGVVRAAEPAFPAGVRTRAIEEAVAFVTERLNGEDGLGAIYPAMANTVMMFDTLGYAPCPPARGDRLGRGAESCWSSPTPRPIASRACRRSGIPAWQGTPWRRPTAPQRRRIDAACAWLVDRQVTDLRGDWAVSRPDATARRLGVPV